MARPKSTANMTIADLEKMLSDRKLRLNSLLDSRNKLAAQLAAADKELAALRGTSGGSTADTSTSSTAKPSSSVAKKTAGKRAKNEMSLVAMLEKVLNESGKPTTVGDILAAVEKGGYKSSSANFRGLINQTLIKDKRFSSAGRGLYEVKK